MSEVANIVIGADYFRRNARADYSSPLPFVWIREAIQNSIDAGAKNININTTGNSIVLIDDGCGMDKDTITNKLLTLGGTKKDAGSIGGFGKAKEVLFFSWDSWGITTSVDGKNALHISDKIIGKEPIKEYKQDMDIGTTIIISIDSSYLMSNWVKFIIEYVSYCTVDCKISLNHTVLPQFKTKKKYTEHNWFKMVVVKADVVDARYEEMVVRINGIPMFNRYIGGIKGVAVVEILGNSIEFLSGNRDSVHYPMSRELDTAANNLVKNPKSAIVEDTQHQIDMYVGINIKDLDIPEDKFNAIEQTIEEHTQNDIISINELNKIISSNIPSLANTNCVQDYMKKECGTIGPMGYSFVVKRNGRTKPNIKIESKRAQMILHYWTNIILKLARENNYEGDIGVGLTFVGDTIAELSSIEGKKFFLINPTKIGKTNDKISLGIDLFMSAAHEFSHLWYVDHDEYFTSKLGTMLKSLSSNWSDWNDLFILSKREVLAALE